MDRVFFLIPGFGNNGVDCMDNLFSIIMPAYNAENTIRESIISVLNQDFVDYELIVVNDGSTDHTRECVEKFENDKIVLLNVENSGVSNARNAGIAHSTGKYICFLDSDDLWMKNHLSTLKKLIKTYPLCNAFCTSYQIRNFNGKYSIPSRKTLEILKTEDAEIENYFEFQRKNGNFLHINSFCVKKEILAVTGCFQPFEKIGEDTDFFYRIFARYSLVVSKKITSEYRRNPTSVTAKRVFNYRWCFLENYKSLINDDDIKDNIKNDIIMVINQYKISAARNMILEGKKKEAKLCLLNVNKKMVVLKNYYLTWILLFLPSFIAKIAVKIRDKGYNEN